MASRPTSKDPRTGAPAGFARAAQTTPNRGAAAPAASHRVHAPDLAARSSILNPPKKTDIDNLERVLFLDVDGVLHSPNPKHERLQFRKPCMELLRDVCRETKCTIVLSTSWRLHVEARAHLASKLAEHGCPPFVSRTPNLAQFQRPREILAWVAQHRPRAWVAVDDWPLHEDERMSGHFVQTRNRHGLQPDTAARICSLFAAQRAGAAGDDDAGPSSPAA